MDYSRTQLMSMYRALPQDLKDALYAIDTAEAIQTVSKAYGLHIDQMGMLSNAIGQILLGVLHPRDFTKRIKADLGIDEQKAAALTREINLSVFTKIRESLKHIHSLREEGALDRALNDIPDRESLLKDIEEPPRANTGSIEREIPKEKVLATEEQAFTAKVEPLLHIPRKIETKKAPDPYREAPL